MKKIKKQTITSKTRILTSLLLLSLILLFCLTTVSAASGDTLYVNGSSGNDSWDGQLSVWNGTSGPKLSIKNATGTVNTNGTIHIANGQYTGENNTNITINKNLNIIGESQSGTIINGTGTNWIFLINSGVTVNLTNLTLTNATAAHGSAISNGGTLTVTNCTFTNNTASDGGAIHNLYGAITSLSGCTFTNNTAYRGGAILNSGTIISLSGCTFTNNNANIDGGAICNDGGTINSLNGCTFTNNIAGGGGAIHNDRGTITLLSSCNFTNNTATNSGGAIYNFDTITNLSGCKFTNNTATNSGGAICNLGTITSLSGCNFTNNTATNSGGAIYTDYYTISSLSGCNFTGNTATISGGAIYNTDTITNLSRCSFTNNTASTGGAIYNSLGTITSLNGCNFTKSTSTDGEGGAITNWKGTITNLSGCTFTNNTAYGHGVICNYGGSLTANYNRFYNNTPTYGSTIYCGSGSVNADYNWWGSNNPIWSTLINGFTNPSYWVILTVNTNPTTINNTQTTIITADLNHYTDNTGTVTELSTHIPDGQITLSIPWGSFTSSGTTHTTTLNTVNDAVSAVFYANEGAAPLNPVEVTATADGYATNSTESAYITINRVAHVQITKTVNSSTPNYGDSVTFTITAHNEGPDTVTGLNVTDLISGSISSLFSSGLTFVSANTQYGTYNSNTGIWDIGSLLNGEDAVLNITCNVTGTGTIVNWANVTAQTTTDLTPWSKDKATLNVPNASDVSVNTEFRDLPWGNVITEAYYKDKIYVIVKVNNNGPNSTSLNILNSLTGITWTGTYYVISNIGSIPNIQNNWVVNDTTNTFNGTNWNIPSLSANLGGAAKWLAIEGIVNQTGTLSNHAETANQSTYPYDGYNSDTTNLTAEPAPTSITTSNTTGVNRQIINLTATLTDNNGNPLTGKTITFKVNGNTVGTATTNEYGIATYEYTITQTAGTYTITAIFTDGAIYANSTGTGNLTVKTINTTITVNNVTGVNNGKVNLTATLKDTDGNLLNGKTVTFTINGVTVGTATTNKYGTATFDYTITQPAGTYTITAIFTDAAIYTNSSNTGNLTVNTITTNLTVNNATGVNNEKVNLTATLTDSNGNPLNGKTITFTVNGIEYNRTTNEYGIATYEYTITQTAGTYTITANFTDGIIYTNSTGNGILTVNTITTNLTVNNVTGVNNGKVNLTAILTDSDGNPLSSKTVTFKVDGVTVGTATTNEYGIATYEYTITQTAAKYTITANFTDGTIYTNSSSTGTLTVNTINTTLTVNNTTGVNGEKVNLTATLTDSNDNPLTGKTIIFTVNGTDYTAITGYNGTATYEYTITQPAGTYTITTSFTDGLIYTNSTGTGNLTINTIATNLTIDNVTGYNGKTVDLTATLKDADDKSLSGKTVAFIVNGVTVGNATTDASGVAALSYKLTKADVYTVRASFIDGSIYANSTGNGTLTVKAAANIYINTTTSNSNPTVGETFTLTYKLGNYGPDPAENVTITFQIPEGLDFINIRVDNGKCSYNKTTRTVTWTLDSVPVGDPYLYLTVKAAGDGTYKITPNVTSNTYNTNTSGDGIISVNVQLENNSGNGNGTNTVKAATKTTIGLQNTGLPFNYLILAILMVLGGLVPKRK